MLYPQKGIHHREQNKCLPEIVLPMWCPDKRPGDQKYGEESPRNRDPIKPLGAWTIHAVLCPGLSAPQFCHTTGTFLTRVWELRGFIGYCSCYGRSCVFECGVEGEELKSILHCAALNRPKNTISITGTREFFWLAKAFL